MNLFQIVTLGALAGVLAGEAVRGVRSSGSHRLRLLRCLVWIAAGSAVAFPDLVQGVASLLGIGRGADVVLYLFVLMFLAATFFLYARIRRQQQHITDLVRHFALLEARRGRGAREDGEANGTPRPFTAP